MAKQKIINRDKLYDPRINPQQMKAHSAPERYILYGGAWGGGKTAMLVNEIIQLSLDTPGNRGFIGCRDFVDFRDNAMLQLIKFLPQELYAKERGGIHHQTDHYIRLTNGSVIMYGGLGNDIEAVKAISNMPELGWFAIDQAEQITENQFLLLCGRLRLNLPGIRYRGLLTANPEPGWLRERFIENTEPNHIFIPALAKDNPKLPPDYVENLKKQYANNPDMVKRMLEGDWDVTTGTNYLLLYSQIREAVNRKLETSGDKVAGVDVSRYGDDETVFILRQGGTVLEIDSWIHQDTQYSAGRIANLIRKHKPIVTNIDIIGVGAGVFDPLQTEGYSVRAINVGEAPLNKELYVNKRAEYFSQLQDMFVEGTIDIPDHQKLTSQLASIRYTYNNTKLQIESKESARRHGLKSPDYADALCLCCIGAGLEDSQFRDIIPVAHFG